MEIAWLAVEKEYQGRGIGTALVEAAEEYACRRGKWVLTVKTYGGMDYKPYNMTMRFCRGRDFRLYEVISNYEPFEGQPAAILIKQFDCSKQAIIAKISREQEERLMPAFALLRFALQLDHA